jgi:hypothetical protein
MREVSVVEAVRDAPLRDGARSAAVLGEHVAGWDGLFRATDGLVQQCGAASPTTPSTGSWNSWRACATVRGAPRGARVTVRAPFGWGVRAPEMAYGRREHPAVRMARWTRRRRSSNSRRSETSGSRPQRPRLLVPMLRDADRVDLLGLARETERLMTATRGSPGYPRHQQEATFKIIKVGAARGWLNASLIRHPEVAILRIGRDRRTTRSAGPRVVVGQVMPLAPTFSHHVIDGDTGLALLLALRRQLEQPELLPLGERHW